jgi:hypothetical protein
MNYKIKTYPPFDREAKRLSKRYKSLKEDIREFLRELKNNPQTGTDLGSGLRKVRMAITAKGKGKSGGARIITLTLLISETESTLGLLYIYDKSERESISDKELIELRKKVGL